MSQTNEIQVAHAREVTLKILDIKRKMASDFIELGRLFKDVRDNKLWELEGAETFNAYIAETGFDKTTVYKFIRVCETFVDKYKVDSNRLEEAGWVKLAKVAPHVDDNNYEVMLDIAENNSLSDIDAELVKQHYIVKKETDSQFVTCPYCHRSFIPTKRQDKQFSMDDYKKVISAYEEAKETKFTGKEYDPIMQSVKTMFLNGRTVQQIVATIEWLKDNAEYEWSMKTVTNKIAEILPKLDLLPQKELNSEDENLLRQSGINI
jgi:transcription elongation factor Elf1